MSKQRDEVVVGIFVLIAVVVAITGTLWLARRGFNKSYPEYTRFTWGQNVKAGQPVNLAGVQVGYVDAVELDVFRRAMELEHAGRSIVHLELGAPDVDAPAHVVDAAVAALRAE